MRPARARSKEGPHRRARLDGATDRDRGDARRARRVRSTRARCVRLLRHRMAGVDRRGVHRSAGAEGRRRRAPRTRSLRRRELAEVVLEGQELAPSSTGRRRARLEQRDHEGHVLGTRDLDAASCGELMRSAAFVIVLIVNPDALLREPAPAPTKPPEPPPPAKRAEAPTLHLDVEQPRPPPPSPPRRAATPPILDAGAGDHVWARPPAGRRHRWRVHRRPLSVERSTALRLARQLSCFARDAPPPAVLCTHAGVARLRRRRSTWSARRSCVRWRRMERGPSGGPRTGRRGPSWEGGLRSARGARADVAGGRLTVAADVTLFFPRPRWAFSYEDEAGRVRDAARARPYRHHHDDFRDAYVSVKIGTDCGPSTCIDRGRVRKSASTLVDGGIDTCRRNAGRIHLPRAWSLRRPPLEAAGSGRFRRRRRLPGSLRHRPSQAPRARRERRAPSVGVRDLPSQGGELPKAKSSTKGDPDRGGDRTRRGRVRSRQPRQSTRGRRARSSRTSCAVSRTRSARSSCSTNRGAAHARGRRCRRLPAPHRLLQALRRAKAHPRRHPARTRTNGQPIERTSLRPD